MLIKYNEKQNGLLNAPWSECQPSVALGKSFKPL